MSLFRPLLSCPRVPSLSVPLVRNFSLAQVYTSNNIQLVNFSLTDITTDNHKDFRSAVVKLKSRQVNVGIVSRQSPTETLSTLESFKISPNVYSYRIHENMKKSKILNPRHVIFAGNNVKELKNAQGDGVLVKHIKDTNELSELVEFVISHNV